MIMRMVRLELPITEPEFYEFLSTDMLVFKLLYWELGSQGNTNTGCRVNIVHVTMPLYHCLVTQQSNLLPEHTFLQTILKDH